MRSFSRTGSVLSCACVTPQLSTISKLRLRERIGRLTREDMAAVERAMILEALRRTSARQQTADLLGISRKSLQTKMKLLVSSQPPKLL